MALLRHSSIPQWKWCRSSNGDRVAQDGIKASGCGSIVQSGPPSASALLEEFSQNKHLTLHGRVLHFSRLARKRFFPDTSCLIKKNSFAKKPDTSYLKPSTLNLRPFSRILVDGPERAAARAMLYPVGFKEEDFPSPSSASYPLIGPLLPSTLRDAH
jgi:hypothetical protein